MLSHQLFDIIKLKTKLIFTSKQIIVVIISTFERWEF
jgi:hypothetical protein